MLEGDAFTIVARQNRVNKTTKREKRPFNQLENYYTKYVNALKEGSISDTQRAMQTAKASPVL